MSDVTFPRPPHSRRAAVARACDRVSRAGVWLLPFFYVGFSAMLLLLWRAPASAFWLPAAAVSLAGAMGLWACAFYAASRFAAPAHRTAALAAAPAAVRRQGGRTLPRRFVQMRTRACSQTCSDAKGERMQFMVACFHAHCAATTAESRNQSNRSDLSDLSNKPGI